jgi:hypothetical protein
LDILQALSTAAPKENHEETLDAIFGAVSKLIMTNISGVQMLRLVFVGYGCLLYCHIEMH